MTENRADWPDVEIESSEDAAERPDHEVVGRPKASWRRRTLLAVALALVAFAGYQLATWPDIAALADRDPETTAFIARHRARTGTAPAWRPVPYAQISRPLKRAVVAAEDIGFFDHGGFAVAEIEAALRATFEHGKPLRGASTLSQQLVKNLYLSPSRNPWRKVKEALLTFQLERRLSKQRILDLYLDVAQFGPGIFGAEAAARHYFGTSAANLDSRQAAALAAGLPNPDNWHPGSTAKRYRRQVERIAARVSQAAWLDKVIP